MSLLLSERVQQIPFSSIREIFEEATRMEKAGIDITHMEIGRPDFDTPSHIKEAAITALNNGHVHYSSNSGILELRQAIAGKLKRENNIDIDPERGTVITIGCKEAILNVLLAYVNAGDEVLIPDPAWLEYQGMVKLVGATPVLVPLREEKNFILDPEELASKITNKTKLLILCSPHNPTGTVLPEAHMRELARLAAEYDLLVLSDEIYEKLVYDGARHISIASLPGMFERTFTINGFSKAYAMDGWRLGYVAGPPALIQSVLKVHQYTTTCATTFAQYGAIAAYEGPQHPVQEMVQEFERRRRYLVNALNEIPGVHCVMPEGAFYTFPSIKGVAMTSKEMAAFLLREAQIACVPGSAFGENGEGYVRMAFSTTYEKIEQGVERMAMALQKVAKGGR